MSRFWVVDGHNVIFAIPRLKSLQLTERREEARERLVDVLRRFALARKDPLVVVFDGADLPSNQEVLRDPLLEVVYSRRRPDGADERILVEARSLLQNGHQVTVVTNDVITLAAKLPKAVDHLKVRPFWEKYIEADEGTTDKRIDGDFSDLESEMLARAAAAGTEAAGRTRRPAPAGAVSAAAAASRQDPGAGKDSARDRLRLKKEKGRARHQRRFKRR